MVQLSPSPVLDVLAPSECSRPGLASHKAGSPKMGSTGRLKTLQMDLEASNTIYQGYDRYIEDGLICLKHKIRNIEKKKIKLEDYLNRLKQGETLNKDQLDAVEKYDEIIHNLSFAQQLHKTLDGLTQDLLRAQRKAVRKEQVAKVEADRRLLCTVLQVRHLLLSLQHEHVRNDLLSGLNLAPHLPAPELQSLLDLAALLGVKRDEHLSLENQMERAALVYLDLIEGGDKPVAGSTYKILKEQLHKLLHCGYFDLVATPPATSLKEMEAPMVKKASARISNSIKDSQSDPEPKTSPTQNWKVGFQAIKEQEPPDSWDMEFSETPVSLQCAIQKPWRGAAVYIAKVPVTIKKQASKPLRKKKKSKGEPGTKAQTFIEVYNSPPALPKDHALREQHLEDLMTKIRGSFSFLQASDLQIDNSPTNGHSRLSRRASRSPSPLAQNDPKSIPAEVLLKTLHSTQPARLLEHKTSLTNGEESLDDCDLDLNVENPADEPLHLQDCEVFPSPLLYRRGSSLSTLEEKTRPPTPVLKSGKQSPCNVGTSQTQPFSTLPTRHTNDMAPPAPFYNMHSVFKVNAPLPPNGDVDYNCKNGVFAEASGLQYITASTQTPPEFALPEDELLPPAYQSEYVIGNGGEVYLPPSQSGSNMGLAGQSYYTRGSSRGMARGGKGQAHSSSFRSAGGPRGGFDWYRCGVRSPRGGFIPHAHHRDSGPFPYGVRDSGYQHCFKHGGGPGGTRHNSSGWSDSSQVSSPDRETNYTLVDSAHGDSLSVSTMEVPVTPQGHTLLPMQLYPLPQPLRVAFTSARTVNFAPGTLDQPIAFDLLHSNLGDMFDTQLGRFTCPANGTYVFIFHILKLAVNVPLYINLMRNEEVMVSAYANDGAPDHETASNHAILPLYQGDQVWLRLHRGAIYGSSWKYSTFSGFLLYQD
ncbi:caprin-2 isoform X1 [Hypomesus transpacificus]|uniref:caprin-2 isoform X1 n=1 Tax=Hypomesus transpacificus TaxID=137520 RepID=UPI001F0852FE|nr:caprin-2 isoform X1 [Hypomesus transpacificus]